MWWITPLRPVGERAFRQGAPRCQIVDRGFSRLIPDAAKSHECVGGELLFVKLLGFGDFVGNPHVIQAIVSGQVVPKIRRAENHVNGGALADGELTGAGAVIEQLARGGKCGVRAAHGFHRGQRNRREDADDGNDHQ